MMRTVLLFLFTFTCCISSYSQEYKCKDGKVKFISKAPLNSFDGNSAYLHGLIDLDKNLIDFYIDLNTLKTGIALRDSHMREDYLETEEYPYAEFTGEIKNLNRVSASELKEGLTVTAIGEFKIHGISKKRSITGELKLNANGNLILNTEFPVLLKDHNIEKPSLLGYQIADKQTVKINATLIRQ